MNSMWSHVFRSRMWKPWKSINTGFSCCDFYEKIKSNEDFMKKILSTEKHYWANKQIYKCLWTLFCFLVKCIILVFLGVLTIGIENSYSTYFKYDMNHIYVIKARSEASRFSVTKILYAYASVVCQWRRRAWPLSLHPSIQCREQRWAAEILSV